MENIDMLKKYIDYSNGRITILPGGGVNMDNYKNLIDLLKVNEVHGTKIL